MNTYGDQRSAEEWLRILSEQEAKLKWDMRKGCTPSEYRLIENLAEAVSLVHDRIRRSGNTEKSNVL